MSAPTVAAWVTRRAPNASHDPNVAQRTHDGLARIT
jgi:hypothetical protein